MQGKDHPALRVGSIGLHSIHDGPNFGHTTEEDEQVSPLFRGILVINGLEDTQVWPGVQPLFPPTGPILRRDGFIQDLQESRDKTVMKA